MIAGRLQAAALTFLAVLAVLFGAYNYGGAKARTAARIREETLKEAANTAAAMAQRQTSERRHAVENSVRNDPTSARERLRRDWTRR